MLVRFPTHCSFACAVLYPLLKVLEISFLGIFTVELLLRILVSGPAKFFAYANEDFSWSRGSCRPCNACFVLPYACMMAGGRNLFDFCVVIAGCLDVMFDFSPVRHEKVQLSDGLQRLQSSCSDPCFVGHVKMCSLFEGSFMTFLRIIRLLRVMRMIRLLRFLRAAGLETDPVERKIAEIKTFLPYIRLGLPETRFGVSKPLFRRLS